MSELDVLETLGSPSPAVAAVLERNSLLIRFTDQHLASLARDLAVRFAASATEGPTRFTSTDHADAYSRLRPIALRTVYLAFAHQIEDGLAVETTPDIQQP